MKDKLEVGMYVRTKWGIAKYIKNHITRATIYRVIDKEIVFENVENWQDCLLDNEIIKASHNIIDLIERFDLVNGHLVICKMYENEKDIPTIVKCVGDYYFEEKDIKSIVTHEQMEQMEYKVGE